MSSRIADIMIEARLETRQFTRGLNKLRTEIATSFRGARDTAQPIEEVTRATREATDARIEHTRATVQGVRDSLDASEEATDGLGDVTQGHQRAADAAGDASEKSVEELRKIRREGERLQTQMRWVARDVMKVGFTAGIIGAIFIREFQSIARISFDLFAIFEDINWLLEDIAWIIGEQLAPILQMLVGPVEMIRDFLEAHKGVAKFIGILLILGMVFFTIASLVMMTAGMYAILLFGMRQFGDTVKTIRQDTEKTSGTFEVAINLVKEMGKEMLGIGPAANVAGEAVDRFGNKIKALTQLDMARIIDADYGADAVHEQIDHLNAFNEAGAMTKDVYKGVRNEIMDNSMWYERAGVRIREMGARIKSLKPSWGGARKAGGRFLSGIKSVGKGAITAGAGLAGMIIFAAAMGPLMEGLAPIIEAFGSIIGDIMDWLSPMIEWIAEFINQHKTFVMAIMAITVAVLALTSVSMPWLIILMGIMAALYLVAKIIEWVSHKLAGSGLHEAITMVTTALKIMFWPLYLIYKLFTDFGGVMNKAKSILSKFVGLIRGFGAWIQNIIPDSIIEFAKAVMNLLPNPIELFKSFIDILKGIWDILTGDWKGGVVKIATAVKDIIFEFFKIPIAIVKIGASLLMKLVEAIKSGWHILKNYLSGGSLIPDILDIFLGIPIALLKIGISMIGKLIEGIKNKVSDLLGGGEGGIKGIVSKIIGFFLTIPLELLKIGATFLVKLWEGIKSGIETLTSLIFGNSLIQDIIDFFLIIPKELLSIGTDMLTQLWNGIKGLFDGDFTTNIKALPGEIIDFFLSLPGKMFEKGKEIINKLMEGVKKIIDGIFGEDSVLGGFLTDVIDFFGNLATEALTAGANFIQSFIDGMLDEESNLGKAMNILFGALFPYMPRKSPALKGPLSEIDQWGRNFSSTFLSGIDEGFNVKTIYDNLGGMEPPAPRGGMGGSGDIIIQNEFTIYATIQNKEDLYTLRDEISMKQMEQARRMRVFKGGF